MRIEDAAIFVDHYGRMGEGQVCEDKVVVAVSEKWGEFEELAIDEVDVGAVSQQVVNRISHIRVQMHWIREIGLGKLIGQVDDRFTDPSLARSEVLPAMTGDQDQRTRYLNIGIQRRDETGVQAPTSGIARP